MIAIPAAAPTVPQDREVTARDVMLLSPPPYATIEHDGLRVIDRDLAARKGDPSR